MKNETTENEIKKNESKARISLAECRKILGGEAKAYTDEQLLRIRDWLYYFADTALLIIKEVEFK